ncbi:MAG TPA: hypothetical protein PKU78_05800 [Candidatus Dojkabacteria bacterium]|nr:hypothetical protein [Candidatus Dojkabacteria bacterium]HRO65709.1 hypothetical protein [Candidatus Dojkabacteria bacterium]HRP51126.1 hypothetical protein [Candidatus Dojkabacteria bacterium]
MENLPEIVGAASGLIIGCVEAMKICKERRLRLTKELGVALLIGVGNLALTIFTDNPVPIAASAAGLLITAGAIGYTGNALEQGNIE